jgi:hypothetical protein
MELKRLEEEEHSSSDFVSLAIQDDAALSFVYKDCFTALMPVIVPFEAIFGSKVIIPNDVFMIKDNRFE